MRKCFQSTGDAQLVVRMQGLGGLSAGNDDGGSDGTSSSVEMDAGTGDGVDCNAGVGEEGGESPEQRVSACPAISGEEEVGRRKALAERERMQESAQCGDEVLQAISVYVAISGRPQDAYLLCELHDLRSGAQLVQPDCDNVW